MTVNDFSWPEFLDALNAHATLTRSEIERLFGSCLTFAIDTQLVKPLGLADAIICPECQEHSVTRISGNGVWIVRCPDAGRISVNLSDFDRFSIDCERLAEFLAASLDMPSKRVVQRGDGNLFEIGDFNSNGFLHSTFLLVSDWKGGMIDSALANLDRKGSQATGLVFTTAETPMLLRSRFKHRFVPIQEAFIFERSGIRPNIKQIGRWLTAVKRPKIQEQVGEVITWKAAVDQAQMALIAEGVWSNVQTENIKSIRNWVLERRIGVKMPADNSQIAKHLRAKTKVK